MSVRPDRPVAGLAIVGALLLISVGLLLIYSVEADWWQSGPTFCYGVCDRTPAMATHIGATGVLFTLLGTVALAVVAIVGVQAADSRPPGE